MDILFIVIGVVLVLVVLYLIISYNKFVKVKTMYEEAFSTMDIYLTKRFDVLTKVFDVAKGYALKEKETIESIISLRTNYDNLSNDEKISTNETVDKLYNKFTVEAYPVLKANENFVILSNAAIDVENDLEKSRRYYNGVARKFNTMVLNFPSSIVAKIFKFKKVKMYEAKEEQKNDVNLSI